MKIGDRVRIKPEWQDPGDAAIVWTVVGPPEKGRVDIQAELGLPINPVQTVEIHMVEPVDVCCRPI